MIGLLAAESARAQLGAGDIVVGVSTPTNTFRVYDASADMWSNGPGWERTFIQSVEFDNANEISHNANGNLLGANFGGGFTGFEIFNLATDGSTNSESLWSIVEATGGTKGMNPGTPPAWLSQRGGGLSVSPGNDYVAWTNFETGEIFVHDYSAGPTPGTGAGAVVSGPRRTGPGNGMGGSGSLNALTPGQTQGTAWLNDTTLLAFNAFGELITLDVAGIAGGTEDETLAGWMPTVMTNWQIANTEVAITADQTDLDYNPTVDPNHIYASATLEDNPNFTTQLIAYDYNPTTGDIALNRSITFSNATMNEEREPREIALAANGDLYFSGFAGAGTTNSNNLVMRLPNATNIAGWDAANIEVFYNTSISSSFNGLDVAVGEEDVGLDGDYNGDGSVDAADYVVWRKNDINGQQGYDDWRMNFGLPDGAGSALVSASVPEPASVLIAGLAVIALRSCRFRFGAER
jgi:hypothetical protein